MIPNVWIIKSMKSTNIWPRDNISIRQWKEWNEDSEKLNFLTCKIEISFIPVI